MTKPLLHESKFLGRIFDPRTMTYGIDKLPEEMRIECIAATYPADCSGVRVIGTIFQWKKRLGIKP